MPAMTPARSPTTPPPTATTVEPRSRPASRHCRQPSSSASQLLLVSPAGTVHRAAPRASARAAPNSGMVLVSPITRTFDVPTRHRSRSGRRPSRPASMLTGNPPARARTSSSGTGRRRPEGRAPADGDDLGGDLGDLATGGVDLVLGLGVTGF